MVPGITGLKPINRIKMDVRVSFFGVLAEITGTSFKSYSGISSFGDLRLRIQDDFPEIAHYNFRILHNRVFVETDPGLNDGDEVALLPPFYGA